MAEPSLTIDPPPTDEEAAAIAAALTMAWPRSVAPEPPRPASNMWRFSGRWWAEQSWRRP